LMYCPGPWNVSQKQSKEKRQTHHNINDGYFKRACTAMAGASPHRKVGVRAELLVAHRGPRVGAHRDRVGRRLVHRPRHTCRPGPNQVRALGVHDILKLGARTAQHIWVSAGDVTTKCFLRCCVGGDETLLLPQGWARGTSGAPTSLLYISKFVRSKTGFFVAWVGNLKGAAMLLSRDRLPDAPVPSLGVGCEKFPSKATRARQAA